MTTPPNHTLAANPAEASWLQSMRPVRRVAELESLGHIRAMPLKPRDLIIDNWDRECIVVERVKRPAAGRLADQWDSRVQAVPADTIWWSALVIRGGGVLIPEPLATFVREATVEDATRAVEYANEHALHTIAGLFPEAVERALQRRQKGDHVA
jgi:hypothetical protein